MATVADKYKKLFSLTEKKKLARKFNITLEYARRTLHGDSGFRHHEFTVYVRKLIAERLSELKKLQKQRI